MISGLAKANEKRNYRNKNNVEDRQTQSMDTNYLQLIEWKINKNKRSEMQKNTRMEKLKEH